MADAFEPDEFKGMLFHDGVDSQGRPVIVVNTDAVGTTRKARSQALHYMLHQLEPIVIQVTVQASKPCTYHTCIYLLTRLVMYLLAYFAHCSLPYAFMCLFAYFAYYSLTYLL